MSANRERHLQALKERLQRNEENAQRIRERKKNHDDALIGVLREEESTEASSDKATSGIPAVCLSVNAKKLSSDFAAQPEDDGRRTDIDNSSLPVLPASYEATYYSSGSDTFPLSSLVISYLC